MARSSGGESKTWQAPAAKRGVYIAYDKKGEEIWRKDDFEAGRDSVPTGISIVMGAGEIIDPSSGEVVHRWNPWSVR